MDVHSTCSVTDVIHTRYCWQSALSMHEKHVHVRCDVRSGIYIGVRIRAFFTATLRARSINLYPLLCTRVLLFLSLLVQLVSVW